MPRDRQHSIRPARWKGHPDASVFPCLRPRPPARSLAGDGDEYGDFAAFNERKAHLTGITLEGDHADVSDGFNRRRPLNEGEEEPDVSAAFPWFSRNALAISTVAVLSASVLAACSSAGTASLSTATASPSAATGPVTIGASLSLTGDFAADGQAFQRGYELWAKDVNAHGGLDGRQVKLTILNDDSSPNQVVTNYQTLLGEDHVDLTFGPFSSLLTAPASTVAARYGMAFVEGAGGAPSVFDTPSNQADHNVFAVSLPIADELVPFVHWIASLPPDRRPKTAAYPMAQDPFADPPVQLAQTLLSNLGVKTVYSNIFPEEVADYKGPADQVAGLHPDLVVLGSTDVPTVAAFMQAFEQQHYTPKLFIAAAGPDQGTSFTSVVGTTNADGMMVPDGWYPGYDNAASRTMVREYVAQFGGTASGVNADVAEAYSVGQVMAQAVSATGGTDNAKIITYLHSSVTLNSVQGPVKFDALGENGAAAAFIFQWQNTSFDQVLPANGPGASTILATKPPWAS
jgi:branched-chain amino acid transport system substrate-binding protein